MKHVVGLLVCAVLAIATPSYAQGVTTASITGLVKDASGGVIPGASVSAVHQPSGTSYEAVTQADGRFTIPGMRVGGPYTVTAQLSGFTTEVKNNITLVLGVAQDVEFSLKVGDDLRDDHRRRRDRPGVQHLAHRRRDGGDARGPGRRCRRFPAASPTSRA